jgi:predicted DNA-binding WGR domain protein
LGLHASISGSNIAHCLSISIDQLCQDDQNAGLRKQFKLEQAVVRSWSRIGTNGQELVEIFATEVEAGQALEAVAAAKRRREYRDL